MMMGGGYVQPQFAGSGGVALFRGRKLCLYYKYCFVLIIILFHFSAHPIELEGVHILTKAHGRAPVCWRVPPRLQPASRLTYVCTLVDGCPRSNLSVSLVYSLSAP